MDNEDDDIAHSEKHPGKRVEAKHEDQTFDSPSGVDMAGSETASISTVFRNAHFRKLD